MTAKAFAIKPRCKRTNISESGFAKRSIPKTAEKERIKLKEKAVKGFVINIKNDAVDKIVKPS